MKFKGVKEVDVKHDAQRVIALIAPKTKSTTENYIVDHIHENIYMYILYKFCTLRERAIFD